MKKDLYLISTFTHEWNRSFNFLLEKILEGMGLDGYFAHRDTDQTSSPDIIFQGDLGGIIQSKLCLAVAQNETPNWGAEIGFAYANNIPVIALTSLDHEIPLICNGMLHDILRVESLNDIDNYSARLVEIIRKYGE